MEFTEEVKKEIVSEAHDISGWLQDAIGDMAGTSEESMKFIHSMDPKKLEQIKQAKKNGVIDLPGWFADELYNEVDTLCDLTGDRIHDGATTIMQSLDIYKSPYVKYINKEHIRTDFCIAIATKMKENAHTALATALQVHINDWEKYLKERKML